MTQERRHNPPRVAVVYPPITRGRRRPHLGQNRQLQFTWSPWVKPQPMIPAYLATMLQRGGARTLWLDALARPMSRSGFEAELCRFDPHWIVMETKAPVVEEHWRIADRLLELMPRARTVLVGDHVSLFPEESLEQSGVYAVARGGDYDSALCRFILEGGPVPGIWVRDRSGPGGAIEPEPDLDSLPFPDRRLTRMSDYGEAYLRKPSAYIISARGCARGRGLAGACSFCIWQQALWGRTCRARSPENAALEVADLVREHGVREVFDDAESGMLHDPEWIERFGDALARLGVLGRVAVSGNARADALTHEACELARRAGFRLLKVGLESASDRTLERIGKGQTVDQVVRGVRLAKRYGLRVFLTVMIGYPWETEAEIAATWELARELMRYKPALGDGVQVSFFTPYPGTEAHHRLAAQGLLPPGGLKYSDYDMDKPLWGDPAALGAWMRRFWSLYLDPGFLAGNLLSLRGPSDAAYAWLGVRSLAGHLRDSALRRMKG